MPSFYLAGPWEIPNWHATSACCTDLRCQVDVLLKLRQPLGPAALAAPLLIPMIEVKCTQLQVKKYGKPRLEPVLRTGEHRKALARSFATEGGNNFAAARVYNKEKGRFECISLDARVSDEGRLYLIPSDDGAKHLDETPGRPRVMMGTGSLSLDPHPEDRKVYRLKGTLCKFPASPADSTIDQPMLVCARYKYIPTNDREPDPSPGPVGFETDADEMSLALLAVFRLLAGIPEGRLLTLNHVESWKVVLQNANATLGTAPKARTPPQRLEALVEGLRRSPRRRISLDPGGDGL